MYPKRTQVTQTIPIIHTISSWLSYRIKTKVSLLSFSYLFITIVWWIHVTYIHQWTEIKLYILPITDTAYPSTIYVTTVVHFNCYLQEGRLKHTLRQYGYIRWLTW